MSDKAAQATRIMEMFADSWNRHDMADFASLFALNAEFVNVVGLWWKGRDEIRKAHEFAHASFFKESRLTMDQIEVRVVDENVLIARCRWTLIGHVTPDGAPLPPRNGILVNILARGQSGWSIIDSQNTDIVEHQLSIPQ
jgi:uncharacterized protein (TIGR02246 family)